MSRPLYYLHFCVVARDVLRCGSFPSLTYESLSSRHWHSLAALALTNFDQTCCFAAFLSSFACGTFARFPLPPATNAAYQVHVFRQIQAQLVRPFERHHTTNDTHWESHVRRRGSVRVWPAPTCR
jgi:hypothetical protein